MPAPNGPMQLHSMKGGLSPARRRLVESMQEIGFGRVDGLKVRDADPVWSPAPRIVRQIRLGRGDGPHPMRTATDFALRSEVLELLALFDRERDLNVESLDVQHGLPVRVVVETEGGA
ncbi:MAG: hypothetical protein K8T90_09150 [Planctomycetes bacterium]|nr:hypothetical protein [Planctomycetota bacterium]